MKLSAKMGRTQELEAAPTIKYVSLLLWTAIRSGQAELLIQKADRLPTLAELLPDSDHSANPHAHLPPPLFDSIARRLEVMSGLVPMKHKTPVSGVIRLNADGKEHELSAHFDHTVENTICRVIIQRTTSEPPPSPHREHPHA
jgi:hypothetical protein